jgi:hypothetical protein
MKKIAFIGCSHSSTDPAYQENPNEPINWTWQLSQRYPQHTYRNYARGGQGIEYFQWCIMHAKKWGADVIFINRTYTGRWAMLGAFNDEKQNFASDWHVQEITENFSEVDLKVTHAWGSGGDTNFSGGVISGFIKKSSRSILRFITNHWAITDLRKTYEDEWYRLCTTMYDFENVFLIDWTGEFNEEIISNVRTDISVTMFLHNKLEDTTNSGGGNAALYKLGLVLSETDNHCTNKGHKIVLDEYILSNENVVKSLTSTSK